MSRAVLVLRRLFVPLPLVVAAVPSLAADVPQGVDFTYQGRLQQNGEPLDGLPDMEFRLYDALVDGMQIGVPALRPDVPVEDGVFAVELDFGAPAFNGAARWLEIRIDGVLLEPRQRVTSTPYALRAQSVVAGSVDGSAVDSDEVQRRVTGVCANGESVRVVNADGSVACETDDVGGAGTITGVNAVQGLSGGGSAGSVDVGIADGGVTTLKIGDDQVTSPKIANGTVAAVDVNSAQVQLRVGSTCAAGSAIRQVNADGTVVCDTAPTVPAGASSPRPPYGRASIDTVGAVRDIAMTIGVDGLALLSWYEDGADDLRVGHCNDVACTSVTETPIDTNGDVGEFSAISIDGAGRGVVSYYDRTNGNLKLARCNDVACTGATLQLVDGAAGNVGQFTGITINTSGFPTIAYKDVDNGDLKVAGCSNATCSTSTIVTLDNSANDVGNAVSVTRGASGRIYIAHHDATAGDAKLSTCNVNTCVVPTNAVIDTGDVLPGGDIVVTSDHSVLVAYIANTTTTDVRVAYCNQTTCPAPVVTTINATLLGSPVRWIAAARGRDGLATFGTAFESMGGLFVQPRKCLNASCTLLDGLTQQIDTPPGASKAAAALGDDDNTLFAYRLGAGNLAVLHCSGDPCYPFYRGR